MPNLTPLVLNTLVEGVPCSSADLRGATSFRLVVTPDGGAPLAASFTCDSQVVSVALAVRDSMQAAVQVYGIDPSGSVLLAGMVNGSDEPVTITPGQSNALTLRLGESDGTTGSLRIAPIRPMAAGSGDVCAALNQPTPSVTVSDGTQSRGVQLKCVGSTSVSLPVGKWTVIENSLSSSLGYVVPIMLGQRRELQLEYFYNAPLTVPFAWTFRSGQSTLSCEQADAGFVSIASPDFELEPQVFPCRDASGAQGAVVRFDHARRLGSYHFNATWSGGGWATFTDAVLEPGALPVDGGVIRLVSYRN